MKNEVTVLIPTRNRSKFLKRSLSYYKSVKINCNFIIGDSSTDLLEKKKIKKISLSLKKNFNITYLYFSNDIGYGKKLSEMVRLSKTKFTAIIGDDDFIIKSGLIKCWKYLKENKSNVAVYGQRIGVAQTSQIENKNWYSVESVITKNINQNDYLARIRILDMPSWTQHLYSLYRTEILKESLNSIARCNYNSITEYLLYLSICIYGKWEKIDCFYALCNFETNFNRYRDRNSFPHYWGNVGGQIQQLSTIDFSKNLIEAVDNISKSHKNFNYKILKDEILKCFWYTKALSLQSTITKNYKYKKIFSKKILINLAIVFFLLVKNIFTINFWSILFKTNALNNINVGRKKKSTLIFIINTLWHFRSLKYTYHNLYSKNKDFKYTIEFWKKFPDGKV